MTDLPEAKRVLHCWADRGSWIEKTYGWGSDEHLTTYSEPGATCVLLDGHAGPHEWTPDDQIVVHFPGDSAN